MEFQLQSLKRSCRKGVAVSMPDGQSIFICKSGIGIVCFALCIFAACGSAEPASDLIFEDLNRSEWTISNQNGSISFSAGQLPVMVLEALVKADQVDQGDPLAG